MDSNFYSTTSKNNKSNLNNNISNFNNNVSTPMKSDSKANNFHSAYRVDNRSPLRMSATPEVFQNTQNYNITNFFGHSPFQPFPQIGGNSIISINKMNLSSNKKDKYRYNMNQNVTKKLDFNKRDEDKSFSESIDDNFFGKIIKSIPNKSVIMHDNTNIIKPQEAVLNINDLYNNLTETEKEFFHMKKIHCKCKKSKCTKLYCECLANNEACIGCACENCDNKFIPPTNEEQNNIKTKFKHENAEISRTTEKVPNDNYLTYTPKNPFTHNKTNMTSPFNRLNFKDLSTKRERKESINNSNIRKISFNDIDKELIKSSIKMPEASVGQPFLGCNCYKSNCSKKYCECFKNGVSCNEHCRCPNCENIFNRDDIKKIKSTLIQSYNKNKTQIDMISIEISDKKIKIDTRSEYPLNPSIDIENNQKMNIIIKKKAISKYDVILGTPTKLTSKKREYSSTNRLALTNSVLHTSKFNNILRTSKYKTKEKVEESIQKAINDSNKQKVTRKLNLDLCEESE